MLFEGFCEISQTMLPDGLHPNAAGMDVMASCLEAAIAPLMQADTSAVVPLAQEDTSNVLPVEGEPATPGLVSMQDTGSAVSNSSTLEARLAADA